MSRFTNMADTGRKINRYGRTMFIVLFVVCLTGCGSRSALSAKAVRVLETYDAASAGTSSSATAAQAVILDASGDFDLTQIPAYDGQEYYILNDNVPDFSDAEINSYAADPAKSNGAVDSYCEFSQLDDLGRCGSAEAILGPELLPTQERGEIGDVRPSGWQTVKYNDLIDGNYLYNRCHLIAYSLCGVNADERNLITGTRYLNVQGMLPFESEVVTYIEETGGHVLYRVTPIFEGDHLLASGVHMEAESVEDDGAGVRFNVYCYNVQPGIEIDYATGDSRISEDGLLSLTETVGESDQQQDRSVSAEDSDTAVSESTSITLDYVLNKNTHKFHYPDCRSVKQMKEKNKEYFTGTREEVIGRGYDPCQNCNP